jgi:hypothetical protein
LPISSFPSPDAPRGTARLLAALLFAAGPAFAQAEPPPGLFEVTEGAFAQCAAQGRSAEILDGFQSKADLNADGAEDFVLDFHRIACGGEAGALCEADGCPATAWLSQPDGGYAASDLGLVTGLALDPAAANGRPRLTTLHAPAICALGGLADAPAGCSRDWTFTEGIATPSPYRPLAQLRPRPRPAPDRLRTFAPAPGWTLRGAADAEPVAMGVGPDALFTLAAFCLGDAPFVAMRFREPPQETRITVTFGFSSGDLAAAALYEETAGGAFVIDLTASDLADRLAGADSEARVDIDGANVGTLSLKGSTDSLHRALAACHDF